MGDINGAVPPGDGLCGHGAAQSRHLAAPLPSLRTMDKALCLLPLQKQILSQHNQGEKNRLADASVCQTWGFWHIVDRHFQERWWDVPQAPACVQSAQGNPQFIGNLTGVGKD